VYSSSPINGSFYILVYLILAAFSAGVFLVFLPFKYVDPIESLIYCSAGQAHASNSTFVFSVDGRLDSFNDNKARKLCAYGAIMDYQDFYQEPDKINYRFVPKFSQESSAIEAFLASFVTFSLGVVVIEITSKVFHNIFAADKTEEARFNIGRIYLKIISFLIN
jgi:hypothetical protein